MNLVIDIGNKNIKTALFEKNNLLEVKRFLKIEELESLVAPFKGSILVSSVAKKEYNAVLLGYNSTCQFVNIIQDLPIVINYETPQTLGIDRVLAAVGAKQITKNGCLIVDIGTCMTLDFLDRWGVFQGGVISPGPELRFQSMHNFTASLPLETLNIESTQWAKSTKEALQSGVKFGIIHEIMGTLQDILKENDKIDLVLTGGYSYFFDSMLKEGIFVEPNLVLIGLNTILNNNAKK